MPWDKRADSSRMIYVKRFGSTIHSRMRSTAVIGKLLKSCDTNGYEGEV